MNRTHQELRLFGTSGVRGLTNIEITPAFTLKLSEAFGIFAGAGKTIVVGRDTRNGSETIQTAAMTGLASVGVDVEDCGCLPVGALLHYLVRSGAHGGLMITGSYLPPDRIGIIPILGDGSYAGPETALRIEHLFFSAAANRERISADRIGRIEKSSVIAPYLNDLVNIVDTKIIEERSPRVLIDPGSGTASQIMSSLLKKLGCDVISVNDNPKSLTPKHYETREDSLKKAAGMVVKYRCDLGVLYDNDADRAVFIDPQGSVVSGDYIGAIFARETLKKGDTCAVPVNCSALISHICTRLRAHVFHCAVGQPHIVSLIKFNKSKFAYDTNGKYYFPEHGLWSDGLVSTLKLLEVLSRPRVTLDHLVNTFPSFYQRSISIECAGKYKTLVMEKIPPIWTMLDKGRYVKKVDIDGLKRHYDDYSWLLIRPSGNEPAIRIYSDAMNPSRARELIITGEKIVRRAMRLV